MKLRKKKYKGIHIRKEKVKIFLFADDMIVSIRNSKKLLKVSSSEFNKVQNKSKIRKIILPYIKKEIKTY